MLPASGVAAALVALMAANRYETAEAAWTGVVESARAAGELETLRLAVALRALVRLRMGRVADVEADLTELIAWVGELQLPLRAYRTALPFVIAPLIDALVERGELEQAARWPAITGLERGWPEEFGFTFLLDSLARLRLAQGRATEALHLARECDRRQRAWGFRTPASSPTRLDARRRAARDRPHHGGAGPVRRADRPRAGLRRRSRARDGPAHARRDHGRQATLDAAADSSPARPRGSSTRMRWSRSAAASRLRAALDIAERCGATALAARARDALVAHRRDAPAAPRPPASPRSPPRSAASPASPPTAPPTARSPRRLFLTEKTVEGHLPPPTASSRSPPAPSSRRRWRVP